jgi:competence CoiA-like predicted nuclease
MLVAKNPAGRDVLAWDADGECRCPECNEKLFVKDGAFKITHFSHYPDSSCSFGAGEGMRHQMLKARIFESLKGFTGVQFEKKVIERRRADVVVPGEKMVVECQASTIHEDEWLDRTADYSAAGYGVLWIWDSQRCELDAWPEEMVLCHRLSYGQLTVINPEIDEWHSLHLSWTGEYGQKLRSRFRRPRMKPLTEPTIRHVHNDGLRLIVLSKTWWK